MNKNIVNLSNLYFEFFLFILLIRIYNSFVAFPLEIITKENYIENNNIHSKIIENYYFRNIYTIIEIGTPPQKIPLFINPKETDYVINNFLFNDKNLNIKYNLSYNYFNENNSKTYKTDGCKEVVNDFDELETICLSNDTFILYKDVNLQQKINFDNFYFKLMKNEENDIPGQIGLGLFGKTFEQENNFLKILNNYNLIKQYYWYFDFDSWNNTNGKLIIGAFPHETCPEKYSEDDLIYSNIYIDSVERDYKFDFDKIYIINSMNNSNNINLFFKKIEFVFDMDLIIGTTELEMNLIDYIFKNFNINKNYFNETFRATKYSSFRFYYFSLELKDILYELISVIKIFSNELNYTFEVTKDELFTIKDNYIYLNILFPILMQKQQTYFIIGKVITLKYPFIFNSDLKQLGLYKKINNKRKTSQNSNNNKIIIIIVIIVVSIILVIIGIIIGKIINRSNRKKRANELVDDYEYVSEDKIQQNTEKNENINYLGINE